MSAENDGSPGNLLPPCSVQRAACSDHQAGLSDYRFGDVLPAAMPADHDVPHGETNLSRAKGNVLLTQASDLRGASRSRCSSGSEW